MWSGPRNVSTAFMRSWENRPDTIVVDEPFYAHYLAVTGLDHPGRDEILAHHERDWRRVVESLLAPLPPGVEVLYQKQMSHHLLPDMGREWLASMTHAFLIRDPAPMLASLEEKLGRFDLDATGLPQQVEIFDFVVRTTGRVPPVVDSADLLVAPEPMLRALCAALDIPFTPRMLSWPVGPRASDGIWARHWYERVERSTGFEPAAATEVPDLQGRLAELEGRCRPLYEKLRAHRLRA
jgi:Sulfotransferase domain